MPEPQRDDQDDRGELAQSLHALRRHAKLTQMQLAERANLSQPQVSRAEQDRRLLRPDEVRRWAETCGATAAEQDRLAQLAEQDRNSHVDSRVILQRGAHHFQERIRRYEEKATLIRAYQPGMILGQIQTADYTAAVAGASPDLTPEGRELFLTERQRRRAQISQPTRRWVFVQTEGALNWCLRSPALMASQMQRLVEASGQPNIELGVIPARTPANVVAPHGFHIYDSTAVQVGTKTGTALLSAPDDVASYEALFEELARLAVYGDEARALLEQITQEYRRLSQCP